MTAEGGPIETALIPEAQWDEAKVVSSLARLQEMHIQVKSVNILYCYCGKRLTFLFLGCSFAISVILSLG